MLDTLSGAELAYAATVLTIAYFVRGLAGFGSGLIAIPLLVIRLPLQQVVPLIVLLDYIASASQGARWHRDVRWRELLPLLPFSMLGVLLALFFLKTASTQALSQALGAFVLFFGTYQLTGLSLLGGRSIGWTAFAGCAGGLVGTLFGTGGPFYVVYFRMRGLGAREFLATFAATFLIDGGWRLVGYASTDLFTRDFLLAALAALPVMAVALHVGGHVHTRMRKEAIQHFISLLLIGSGITLLAK